MQKPLSPTAVAVKATVLPMSCSAVAASAIRVMRCVMRLPHGEYPRSSSSAWSSKARVVVVERQHHRLRPPHRLPSTPAVGTLNVQPAPLHPSSGPPKPPQIHPHPARLEMLLHGGRRKSRRGKTVRERERRKVREGNIRLRPCRPTDEEEGAMQKEAAEPRRERSGGKGLRRSGGVAHSRPGAAA